jgi:hypothetical protein
MTLQTPFFIWTRHLFQPIKATTNAIPLKCLAIQSLYQDAGEIPA